MATEPLVYAEQAQSAIRRVVGMIPDFSTESLALVDYYVTQVESRAPAVVRLVATTVGCYFGEVLCRHLGGTWKTLDPKKPERWRFRLEGIPLSVLPVGMAAEAIVHAPVSGYDGSLHIAASLRPLLERTLAAMSPVSEETYYSLTGRLETLEHVREVLGCAAAQGLARLF